MPILNDIACVDDPPNIDGQRLIGQFATLYQQCKGFRQSLTMRALSSTIQRMMGNRRESTPPVPSRGTVYRLTEVQGSRVGQPRRSQKQRRVASCPTPPIPNRGAGYRPTEVPRGEWVSHGCHFLGRTGQGAGEVESADMQVWDFQVTMNCVRHHLPRAQWRRWCRHCSART